MERCLRAQPLPLSQNPTRLSLSRMNPGRRVSPSICVAGRRLPRSTLPAAGSLPRSASYLLRTASPASSGMYECGMYGGYWRRPRRPRVLPCCSAATTSAAARQTGDCSKAKEIRTSVRPYSALSPTLGHGTFLLGIAPVHQNSLSVQEQASDGVELVLASGSLFKIQI